MSEKVESTNISESGYSDGESTEVEQVLDDKFNKQANAESTNDNETLYAAARLYVGKGTVEIISVKEIQDFDAAKRDFPYDAYIENGFNEDNEIIYEPAAILDVSSDQEKLKNRTKRWPRPKKRLSDVIQGLAENRLKATESNKPVKATKKTTKTSSKSKNIMPPLMVPIQEAERQMKEKEDILAQSNLVFDINQNVRSDIEEEVRAKDRLIEQLRRQLEEERNKPSRVLLCDTPTSTQYYKLTPVRAREVLLDDIQSTPTSTVRSKQSVFVTPPTSSNEFFNPVSPIIQTRPRTQMHKSQQSSSKSPSSYDNTTLSSSSKRHTPPGPSGANLKRKIHFHHDETSLSLSSQRHASPGPSGANLRRKIQFHHDETSLSLSSQRHASPGPSGANLKRKIQFHHDETSPSLSSQRHASPGPSGANLKKKIQFHHDETSLSLSSQRHASPGPSGLNLKKLQFRQDKTNLSSSSKRHASPGPSGLNLKKKMQFHHHRNDKNKSKISDSHKDRKKLSKIQPKNKSVRKTKFCRYDSDEYNNSDLPKLEKLTKWEEVKRDGKTNLMTKRNMFHIHYGVSVLYKQWKKAINARSSYGFVRELATQFWAPEELTKRAVQIERTTDRDQRKECSPRKFEAFKRGYAQYLAEHNLIPFEVKSKKEEKERDKRINKFGRQLGVIISQARCQDKIESYVRASTSAESHDISDQAETSEECDTSYASTSNSEDD